MSLQTAADRPQTRLLKTKMFSEQLVIQRKKDGPPGSWGPPTAQTKPLDDAINLWVDQTGNEIVQVTAPSLFMQWMDAERITRLVIATAMVTYVPAIAIPQPLMKENNNDRFNYNREWEPVV